MRACIAGVAGFVGSNLAKALMERGYDVVGFDDLSTGVRDAVPDGVSFAPASIGDPEAVFRMARDCSVLINCACVQMPDAVENPFKENEVDTFGAIVMAHTARATGAKLIHLSSCSVYGHQPDQERISEDAPFFPFTPYSAGKIAGESYVRAYHAHGWIDATVLRLSNVYGPGQDPTRHAGVIGHFVRNRLLGNPSVLNGGGGATRDFTYIDDVTRAIHLSISFGEIGPFNIASGTGTTIKELSLIIGGEYQDAPRREIDTVPYRVLNPTLAGQKLGWMAETDLVEGIEATDEWMARELGVTPCA